jgi:hypothetical protein
LAERWVEAEAKAIFEAGMWNDGASVARREDRLRKIMLKLNMTSH